MRETAAVAQQHDPGGRRSSQYRLPRFPDVPPIDLVILDRKDLPSVGAGECPIVALAPAVASATGTRAKALPLAPN